MKKAIFILAGVFLAFVAGVFLFMRKPQTSTQTTVNPTPSPTPTDASQSAEKVREILVVGNEYFFSPSSINLAVGKKVVLTFRNMGRMPHNLAADELGIKTKTISGGESDTVEFTPSQIGTFSFYCSLSNHRSLGMEGSLEVK